MGFQAPVRYRSNSHEEAIAQSVTQMSRQRPHVSIPVRGTVIEVFRNKSIQADIPLKLSACSELLLITGDGERVVQSMVG